MSTTARDIMTSDVAHLTEEDTAQVAAELMSELGVGAVPVCTTEGQLVGVVTDRDIVVDVVAAGNDPASARLGDLVQGEAVTIGADDPVDEVHRVMAQYQVRRLPVIDGDRLIGIISQGDLAQEADDAATGETVERISE